MDLKDIKAIIDLMKKNSISEFELERQDFKIKLKRGGAMAQPQYEELPLAGYAPQIASSGVVPVTTLPAGSGASGEVEIKLRSIATLGHCSAPAWST